MNIFTQKKRIKDLEQILNQEREQYRILKLEHNKLIIEYEDLIKKQNFARLEYCKKNLQLSLSDIDNVTILDVEQNHRLETITIDRIKTLIAVEEIIQQNYALLSNSMLGKIIYDYINETPIWKRTYADLMEYADNHPLEKEQNTYRLESNDFLITIDSNTEHLINEQYAAKLKTIFEE